MTDQLKVYGLAKANGQIIKKGDRITDFRGDDAIFVHISRFPELGKEGKIIVHEPGNSQNQGEFYPSVFALTIVERKTGHETATQSS